MATPIRSAIELATLLAAGLTILPAVAQDVRNPEQMGPYPVGVTSLQFDDASRPDAELGARPLRTEIWYPAVDAARGMPKNLYSDFLMRGAGPGSIAAADEALNSYRKGLTVAEMDKIYKDGAVRDVQVRDGKWPLLVFSHGVAVGRASATFFSRSSWPRTVTS